jgi:hypothetical protein
MNLTDQSPNLSERDSRIFRLFCEQAVAIGDPLASISMQDLTSDEGIGDMGSGEFNQVIVQLMEQGYLYRAGRMRYVITQSGFERYANEHIENYGQIENAVKDAVAAVDETDTNAIVATTGERKYMVNHILRLLQNRRDIGAFASTADCIHVTRVSNMFKQAQIARAQA